MLQIRCLHRVLDILSAYLLVAFISRPEGNISEQSLIEQHALLLDERDVVAEPLRVEGLYGFAIDDDFPRGRIVELH